MELYRQEGATPSVMGIFQDIILTYYRTHSRSLPWRETTDPYGILVSEIMLQQTQVDRVMGKYGEFLAKFPDVGSLASASLQDVLTVWQGLGYNRRAIALKRTAETIVERFGGVLPESIEALQGLPGIGPYTAQAIATFAFNRPSVFIETNIRTVFIHFFFSDRSSVTDREILPLIEKSLEYDNPRDWYNALMDVGVMLKRQHENPGRKSAHHARQTLFKGSNRELRGLILKMILAAPGVTEGEILSGLDRSADRVKKNLEQLQKEGFIKKTGSRCSIP